jgi:hypothetical protein
MGGVLLPKFWKELGLFFLPAGQISFFLNYFHNGTLFAKPKTGVHKV